MHLLLYQILFLLLFILSLIIVTASASDLHSIVHEKDSHIAQLTRKLQSITGEKKESQKIITTLQIKLQEYKQQFLKTTG